MTPWNEAARYQGTTETSLSEKGKMQAEENSNIVQSLIVDETLSHGPLRIVSSPLKRTRQTADIIRDRLNLEPERVIIDDRLRELSVGRWEGLNSQEVKDQFYEERKARKADRWNFKPLGGESLQDRSFPVSECLVELKPHSIIVTHAGVLRIIEHILGGQSYQAAAASDIPHLGATLWDGDKSHTLVVTPPL